MTILFFVVLIVVLFLAGGWAIGAFATVAWWALTGLVIGALARMLVKDTKGLGMVRTMLAGIAGALGGGLIARALHTGNDLVEFLIALLVAALVIAVATGTIGGKRRAPR